MSAFVKGGSAEAGTFEMVFYRSLFGLAIIWPMIVISGRSIRTRYLGANLRRSLYGVIAYTLWFIALAHLPLGTATTLNYTSPLFVAIIVVVMALRRGKRAPWELAAAIVVAFVGVCLVLRPSMTAQDIPWVGVGVLGASMAPLCFFQIKDLGDKHEPSWRIVFYYCLVGTLWGLCGTYLFEQGLTNHSTMVWTMLVGIGLCALLAQLTLTIAYEYGNMMLTACFQFATIPFSELFSVFFFGQHLDWTTAAGMTIIVTAGSAASILSRKMARS